MYDEMAIEAISRFSVQLKAAIGALAPAMQRFSEQLREVGTLIDEHTWQAYEEAGFPYGANHAGRTRWLEEMGEVTRLRQRAEEILLEHEMHAELRRLLRDQR